MFLSFTLKSHDYSNLIIIINIFESYIINRWIYYIVHMAAIYDVIIKDASSWEATLPLKCSSSRGTMKAIVSITFIVLLYGINSVPISAIRICASRKKNNENFPLKQNTPSVPEDFLNDSNIIHTAVSLILYVFTVKLVLRYI